MQRAIGQPRPITPHLGLDAREALAAGVVEGVVDAVHPFDVGAEAGDAAQVATIVRAESAGDGRWIDEPRKRRFHADREVIALG